MTWTARLARLDRVEFYLDDHVNFKVMWKHSQMTEMIEGYPVSDLERVIAGMMQFESRKPYYIVEKELRGA